MAEPPTTGRGFKVPFKPRQSVILRFQRLLQARTQTPQRAATERSKASPCGARTCSTVVPGSTSTGWPSTNTSIWLPAAVAVVRPERQGKVFVTSPSPAAGRERADPAPVAVSRRRRDSGPAHLPLAAGRHHLPRSAEVGAAAARAVRRAGRRSMVLCGVLRREEVRGCGVRDASRHVTNAPSKARGQGSPCGRLRRQPRPP